MKTSKIFFGTMLAVACTAALIGCKKDDDDEVIPTPTPKPSDTTEVVVDTAGAITCAEAITKSVGETVKVKGYVTFAYTTGTGNDGSLQQSAWLADDATTTKGVLQAYYCTITDSVAKGDLVLVEGAIDHYTNKSGETVVEVKNGTMTIIKKNEGTQVDPNAILQETFETGIGGFTIQNVKLPEGGSYVWQHDSNYKVVKASGYVGNKSLESEGWLISPALDLSKVTSAKLTFEHAAKFQNGKVEEEFQVLVAENPNETPNVSEWEQLTIPTMPTAGAWTSVSSGEIDLTAYAGKSNVRIAFRYVSTTSGADTWQVKNVLVK